MNIHEIILASLIPAIIGTITLYIKFDSYFYSHTIDKLNILKDELESAFNKIDSNQLKQNIELHKSIFILKKITGISDKTKALKYIDIQNKTGNVISRRNIKFYNEYTEIHKNGEVHLKPIKILKMELYPVRFWKEIAISYPFFLLFLILFKKFNITTFGVLSFIILFFYMLYISFLPFTFSSSINSSEIDEIYNKYNELIKTS